MDASSRPIIKESMRIGGRKVDTPEVIEVRYPLYKRSDWNGARWQCRARPRSV